jgi:hypothetical protein
MDCAKCFVLRHQKLNDMKRLLFLLFIGLFCCSLFGACNDDGTGEPRDPKAKVLIDNNVKPLEKRYAAVGIVAWAVVSVIGIGGHFYVNRKKLPVRNYD